MRRIASSRLIGFKGSASNSCHTSSGSRSSNGLRKLTGTPVTGKFGFGGKPDIKGEELAFDISQSYEERTHSCIEPNESKYLRMAGKYSGGQPDCAWIMLNFSNTLHSNARLLHLGLDPTQIDMRQKVKLVHKQRLTEVKGVGCPTPIQMVRLNSPRRYSHTYFNCKMLRLNKPDSWHCHRFSGSSMAKLQRNQFGKRKIFFFPTPHTLFTHMG